MEMMKGIAVLEPGVARVVEDIPKPTIGDYECLVQIRACGFCSGTDSQIIGGSLENGFGGYPTVLGHEGAGEVVAIGKKVRHITVGERWLHPNLRFDVGNGYSKTHGGMVEYGMISDNQAMLEDGFSQDDFPWVKQHRFPDTISFEDAGVLLSLAECHSAVKNFGMGAGDRVCIYGAGPMGIALGLFCKLSGVTELVQIDSVPQRLAMAKDIAHADMTINFATQDVNAVLNGQKFDYVIDAVGFTSILYEGSQRLKPGGKVCALGVLKSNDLLLDTSKLQCNTSVHMLNFPYGEYAIMDETIRLIESGQVNPKDFYSHLVYFEQFEEAFQLVKSKTALKVILTFDK